MLIFKTIAIRLPRRRPVSDLAKMCLGLIRLVCIIFRDTFSVAAVINALKKCLSGPNPTLSATLKGEKPFFVNLFQKYENVQKTKNGVLTLSSMLCERNWKIKAFKRLRKLINI